MKAYKIEILVIDHDLMGEDEIKLVIENTKYPNRCMYPCVKKIQVADIGEWDDDHPLNNLSIADAEYERLIFE